MPGVAPATGSFRRRTQDLESSPAAMMRTLVTARCAQLYIMWMMVMIYDEDDEPIRPWLARRSERTSRAVAHRLRPCRGARRGAHMPPYSLLALPLLG